LKPLLCASLVSQSGDQVFAVRLQRKTGSLGGWVCGNTQHLRATARVPLRGTGDVAAGSRGRGRRHDAGVQAPIVRSVFHAAVSILHAEAP